jgi:hypothetical protein
MLFEMLVRLQQDKRVRSGLSAHTYRFNAPRSRSSIGEFNHIRKYCEE